jgi:hypothetical protein
MDRFLSDIMETNVRIMSNKSKKYNTIAVTGRGGLEDCEMLRVPHCLDNRHRDGDEVVNLMHRP